MIVDEDYNGKTLVLEEGETPKIIKARFTDDKKEAVIITNELLNNNIVSYNRDFPEIKEIEALGWTEEVLEECTIMFMRNEQAQADRFLKFLDLDDKYMQGALSITSIVEDDVNDDDLFRMKLAVMETEEVKNSDRELKSKIRKSKSVLEIISTYAEVKSG